METDSNTLFVKIIMEKKLIVLNIVFILLSCIKKKLLLQREPFARSVARSSAWLAIVLNPNGHALKFRMFFRTSINVVEK